MKRQELTTTASMMPRGDFPFTEKLPRHAASGQKNSRLRDGVQKCFGGGFQFADGRGLHPNEGGESPGIIAIIVVARVRVSNCPNGGPRRRSPLQM